jgi:hypothetical protein
MTFAEWLIDPKTVLGGLLLIPLFFGCVGQKSYKTVVMATSTNLMWLAGAQLNLRLTGIATAVLTIAVGLSLAAYLPYDLVKRRDSFVQDQQDGRRPLLATTRYRDLTTPILEVVMVFSGQTMLIVLYMSELCRDHASFQEGYWFDTGLWVCGWVAQFMIYTQFGFNFTDEVNFWRHVMHLSFGRMVAKQHSQTVSQSMVIDVDWRELVFRSSLAFLVQAVYRVYVWMSIPIYIARGDGGTTIIKDVVPLMYIICLSDLVHPVVIESLHDQQVGEEYGHTDKTPLMPGMD